MVRESERITRVDVRIPNEIYRQIEQIAIETNQPTHHRSGKPVVTPIILNLINLGLEVIAKEDFNLEALTGKVSGINQIDLKAIEDKVTANLTANLSDINQINLAEMEEKLLASLEAKLEKLVETEVSEMVGKLAQSAQPTDNLSDNRIKSHEEAKVPEMVEEMTKSDKTTDSLSDSTLKFHEEVKGFEMVEKPLSSDKLTDNLSDSSLKSYQDAIKEIIRLNSDGLNPTEIARELTGKYYTSKEKTNWCGTQVNRILMSPVVQQYQESKLSSGTKLTAKSLAELMGVNPSYLSKYKSGVLTPPSWFWEHFKPTGKEKGVKWVKI